MVVGVVGVMMGVVVDREMAGVMWGNRFIDTTTIPLKVGGGHSLDWG